MCKKRCKCSVLKQLRLHCVNSLTLLMSMLIDNVLIEVYFCHLSKQYLIKIYKCIYSLVFHKYARQLVKYASWMVDIPLVRLF